MGVAAEVEAEMAVILMRVFRLRLGAKDDFVDERLGRRAAPCCDHAVEMEGRMRSPRASLTPSVARNSPIPQLLQRGRVVGAVDQRRELSLQRFGCGDIGEDHEFLDHRARRAAPAIGPPLASLSSRITCARANRGRAARVVALALQRRIGGPQRPQHRLDQHAVVSSVCAVDGGCACA